MRIVQACLQPIFSLAPKFQQKNKSTEYEIKSPLTDLGNSLGKEVFVYGFLGYRQCPVKLLRCFLFTVYCV